VPVPVTITVVGVDLTRLALAWGDGVVDLGAVTSGLEFVVSHAYTESGVYLLRVQSEDAGGGASSATSTVVVD